MRKVEPSDAEWLAAFGKEDYLLDPYLHARYSPTVEKGQPGIRVRTSASVQFSPAYGRSEPAGETTRFSAATQRAS